MKNQRLISKLIGLTMAGAITATALTGCADKAFNNLATPLTEDTSKNILKVPCVKCWSTDEEYFVAFLGHRDNGIATYPNELSDHKDYKITYSISREDYLTIMDKLKNNITRNNLITPVNFAGNGRKKVKYLKDIIDNYDPISVEDHEGDHFEI